jgi:hypothetical protein
MNSLIGILAFFVTIMILGSALGNDVKLETLIAQSILNEKSKEGHRSLEGCVVGYLSNAEKGPASPLKVWKYTQGNLVDSTMEDYERAVGKDRSQWPPSTFLFKIKSVTPVSATVEVETLYNMGITPTSRGGNAQEWTLEMKSGGWVVTGKRTILFWD